MNRLNSATSALIVAAKYHGPILAKRAKTNGIEAALHVYQFCDDTIDRGTGRYHYHVQRMPEYRAHALIAWEQIQISVLTIVSMIFGFLQYNGIDTKAHNAIAFTKCHWERRAVILTELLEKIFSIGTPLTSVRKLEIFLSGHGEHEGDEII